MTAEADRRVLLILLLIYGVASLAHFIHNAEFLADYPNLPENWTRGGVYGVWVGITLLGITGWQCLRRGYRWPGFLLLVIYAVLGLDSLGHYLLAPVMAHTAGMNLTILFEVTAAALVLGEVGRQALKTLIRPA